MSDHVEGRKMTPGFRREMLNMNTATAQLFAAEYRSRGVRVLLVKPRSLCSASGSGSSADDTRVAVARIVQKVTVGGPSEPGLRVL